jgi:hypothetical protein
MKTLLLLSLAGVLSAGEYSETDRKTVVLRLRDARQMVGLAVSGMTVEQSNFKPASEVWSVTEVIEHLTRSEDFLFEFLKNILENGKPLPDDQPLPDPAEMDKKVLEGVADRTNKAKAPEQAVPRGDYRHWEEALQAFSERRGKTTTFAETFKGDLRRYFIESPMGKLDGHQWLLLMAAHTERHVKQITELMQHESYPKSN